MDSDDLEAYAEGPLTQVEEIVGEIEDQANTHAMVKVPSDDRVWASLVAKACSIQSRAKDRRTAFFARKRDLKKPHEDMAKEIEERFRPVLTRLANIERSVDRVYQIHSQVQRREANDARQAEIEARQAEAREASRQREDAERKAREANDPNTRREAEAKASEAHEKQRIAESQQAAAIADRPEQKSETEVGGQKVTVRQTISDYTITDPSKFLDWCAEHYNDEMPEFFKVLKVPFLKTFKALNGNIPGVMPVFKDTVRKRKAT